LSDFSKSLEEQFSIQDSFVLRKEKIHFETISLFESLFTSGIKPLFEKMESLISFQRRILPILFSTSFETGDLSRFDIINPSSGEIEVIPQAKFEGNYGLKIYAGYSTPYARKKVKSNPLWLRVYFKHPTSCSWDETFHWVNIFSENGKLLLGIRNKVHKISVGWRDGAFWDLVNTDVEIPLNSWIKLELGIKAGNGDGWIEVWKDNQLVYRKTKLNNASYGEPALISLEAAGKTGDFDPTGFYDCVAVSNERIIDAGIPSSPERTSSEFINLISEIINLSGRTFKEVLELLVSQKQKYSFSLINSLKLISTNYFLEGRILESSLEVKSTIIKKFEQCLYEDFELREIALFVVGLPLMASVRIFKKVYKAFILLRKFYVRRRND